MTETSVDVPEECTFRLTRVPALVGLGVLVALTAGAVAATALHLPFSGTAWDLLARLVLFLCWLLVGLPLANAAIQPMPVSVRLDPFGAHVQWADRIEEWPWERQDWTSGPFRRTAVRILGRTGLRTVLVAPRQRRLFRDMVDRYAGQAAAHRQAWDVAEGHPVVESHFWSSLVGELVVWAFLLWWLRRLPPDSPSAWAVFVLVVTLFAWQTVRDLVRACTSIRFQPDGIEERQLGGRRHLIPYDMVERITYRRTRERVRWLTVYGGGRTIKLADHLPLFLGALRVLRERAPTAVWEERAR